MEPICAYALFAQRHERTDAGMNIFGVHRRVNITPDEDDAQGWTEIRDTLYVSFFADEGDHTLLINHENSDWNHSVDLTIRPEHGQSYVQVVEADFPLFAADHRSLNVYSMLLDGLPLGKAYLVSDIRKDPA